MRGDVCLSCAWQALGFYRSWGPSAERLPWENQKEIILVLHPGSGRNNFVPGQGEVRAKMVRNSKTYAWVTIWSAICLPIILWDASYLFFRSVPFHFICFCFPRSDLRFLVRGLWSVEIFTGSGLATKSIRRLIMYVHFIGSAL